MCDPGWYETTALCPPPHRRRAAGAGSGAALQRRLYAAPLPNRAGQRPPRATAGDRPRAGLRRPDRAQRHPRLQRPRPGGTPQGLLAAADAPCRLRSTGRRAAAGVVASQPARLRPAHRHARPAGRALAAGQALAHQPRPAVRRKKRRRDRLIRRVATHPDGVLGFEDEVWWSRVRQPSVSAWTPTDRPLRLVEQSVAKDDPDPKALAWYGLLLRDASATPDQMWLRFVDGRPVSALTIQFLDWCCARLAALDKTALLLVWDNAAWHLSMAVRTWLRAHNRQVKAQGAGVRILPCFLPTKSPWLNPIEPKWTHGKRTVLDPDRLLAAQELESRVCDYYACDHGPRLAITE